MSATISEFLVLVMTALFKYLQQSKSLPIRADVVREGDSIRKPRSCWDWDAANL